MTHRFRDFRLYLISCAVCVLAACHPQNQSDVHLSGRTMGTTYNIKYVPVDEYSSDSEQVKADIDALLAQVNKLMSTYDPESELSHFNQWKSTEPFALSDETLFVMKEAKRLGALSDGVLDVTVGPLVNLWGFGPDMHPEKVPDQATIDQVRANIGLDLLVLHDGSASKRNPALYVDLSTIAKGYGVDQVAEFLHEKGLSNYLVEIGGEMRVAGIKSSGQPWRIAIEKPVSYERSVQKVISIGDNAIATSGDYRIYFEENGVRYSHLINPLDGYPIKHNLVSVTIIHSSSMTADGLATALNVMGKERALELALKQDWAVLLITQENDQFNEYTTPKFDQLVESSR